MPRRETHLHEPEPRPTAAHLHLRELETTRWFWWVFFPHASSVHPPVTVSVLCCGAERFSAENLEKWESKERKRHFETKKLSQHSNRFCSCF